MTEYEETAQVPEDSFMDLAQLDTIPDQHLLEGNQEYSLQVISAKIGESGEGKKTEGQKYLMVTLKATEEPDSRPFNEVFMMPFPGLEQEDFNRRGRQLRDFLQALEFDYRSGWNPYTETDQLVGLEAPAVVKVTDDDEWGEQNSVKKWL